MGIFKKIMDFIRYEFSIETKAEKEAKAKSVDAKKQEQKPTSDEAKEKKEDKWKDVNDPLKYVCMGGKVQCTFCSSPTADLIVTSTDIKLQDKPWATVGDSDGKINFAFTGLCNHPSQQKPMSPPPPCKAIISLGQWKDFSNTYIGNDNALLMKSAVPCMISNQDITITDSGQKTTLSETEPKMERKPKVTKMYWMDEKEKEVINQIGFDESAVLFVETEDFRPNQIIKIPLKDEITGKEYELKGRLNNFGKTKVTWPAPLDENDYEEEKYYSAVSEDSPGYYYQKDGTFLGKIGNSENVYITDKVTFDKVKNNEKIADLKVVAFTEKYKLNNKELLDRAHWCYGEGGGTMPDQLANSLNNRSKMLGEEKMYEGMTTKSKKDPNNPITSVRQKKIYFEQSIKDNLETVNFNYKDFKILYKDNVKSNAKDKIENSKEKFKIKEIKKTVSSNIKVASGEIIDDLDSAAFWVSGSTGETYSLNWSKLGTTVTKVSQTTAYGYPATHWFFNFKKNKEASNTIKYMKEIKLEKPSLR